MLNKALWQQHQKLRPGLAGADMGGAGVSGHYSGSTEIAATGEQVEDGYRQSTRLRRLRLPPLN